MTIRAIYENGVFRPTEPVTLPEGTVAEVHVPPDAVDVRSLVPPGTEEGMIRVYEVLGQRFDSGHHDTAQRHNEHQP
jgi:predicted DNA-binding antitoxin AbrB/MazE fold protein